MIRKTIILGLLSLTLALGLTACQGNSNEAAKAVEAYLQARTQGDGDQAAKLSCAEWENDARKESSSAKSMNAKLDGVACKETGNDGQTATATCEGKIVTAYGGETREWPLNKEFKLVHQDGEWRMCGYK